MLRFQVGYSAFPFFQHRFELFEGGPVKNQFLAVKGKLKEEERFFDKEDIPGMLKNGVFGIELMGEYESCYFQ